MSKKLNQQFKELAALLPQYSYYYLQPSIKTDEDGNIIKGANGGITIEKTMATAQVNHERRLRRAYKRGGMDGVKAYLDSIHLLQQKRKEEIEKQKQASDGRSE